MFSSCPCSKGIWVPDGLGAKEVFLFTSHACLADWELWLAATAQPQERVSYHIFASPGKQIKIQNLKSGSYRMYMTFTPL